MLYDKFPAYQINSLPGRYKEYLLGPTKVIFDENIQVMKKINFNQWIKNY